MSTPEENWASVLTPPGRGAVAVVSAGGERAIAAVDAHFTAANGRPIAEQTIERIVFGHWQDDGGHQEEAVVCRTSANEIEVHCHGGPVAVQRVTQHFAEAGCRIIPWQEWIEKNTPDPITAEALVALAAATTLKTSALLLQQHGGVLKSELQRIQQLIELNQQAEAQERVSKLLQRVPFGLHLIKPWRVVIAGRPNVGKSSLINALAGFERAIVYDQPGTTRDVVSTVTALDGWPVALSDVAGLRETGEPLEAAGIAKAREAIAAADLVLWVVEVGGASEAEINREINELVGQRLTSAALMVLNKCDRLDESTQATRHGFTQAQMKMSGPELLISALTGEGLPRLMDAIVGYLIPEVPKPDDPVPFTQRQADGLARLAAELEANQLEVAQESCCQLIEQVPREPA